jgi:hypothetical protein
MNLVSTVDLSKNSGWDPQKLFGGHLCTGGAETSVVAGFAGLKTAE